MLKWNIQQFAEETLVDDKPPVVTPPADDKKDAKVVPYDRFAEVNSKAKTLEEQLKKFGELGDFDSLSQKLAELTQLQKDREEAEKAKLSEIERAQLVAKEAQDKAAESERKAFEAEQKRVTDRIELEFKLAAKDAQNVEHAFKLADLSSVKFEDGKVTGMEDAITALKESAPYLFAKKEPKQIGEPNSPHPNEEVKTLEAQLEDAKASRDFSKVIELSNKIKQALKK